MKDLVLLFLLIFNADCSVSRPTIQALIADKIERNCTSRVGCEISMPENIEFSWNKLYVFRPGQLNSEIKEIIGVDVDFSEEFSNKYIFILDNKVVYTEEHRINFDKFADGTVMFGMTDESNKFAVIDRSSKFEVRIDERTTGTTYFLNCTNCDK